MPATVAGLVIVACSRACQRAARAIPQLFD